MGDWEKEQFRFFVEMSAINADNTYEHEAKERIIEQTKRFDPELSSMLTQLRRLEIGVAQYCKKKLEK